MFGITSRRLTTVAFWTIALAFVWFVVLPAFSPEVTSLLQQSIPFDWMSNGRVRLSAATRLRWLLVLLPAGMIVHHALFLRYVRAKQFPTRPSQVRNDPKLPTANTAARDAYFGTAALALRYGFPAVMAAALCSTMLMALADPGVFVSTGVRQWKHWNDVLHGLQCGFAGAYLYVVLTLGHRTFRHDVSSGIAMWSAAMFALGPALAGVVAYLVSDGTVVADSVFTKDVVLVVAGMAPRQFAGLLQSSATRFTNGAPIVERRLLPLSKIRGVTEEIEQRLLEEGISDAFTLAYCDPWLLLRSTRFDRRQIAAWVDEALLAIAVAKYAELQERGITGAIDLAWYAWAGDDVAALAAAAGIDPVVLQDTAQRLSEDAQVRLVWTLYQNTSETEPDSAPVEETTRPRRTGDTVYRELAQAIDEAGDTNAASPGT